MTPAMQARSHLRARAEDIDVATDARSLPPYRRLDTWDALAWDDWDDDLDDDCDVWTVRPLRVPLGEIAALPPIVHDPGDRR